MLCTRGVSCVTYLRVLYSEFTATVHTMPSNNSVYIVEQLHGEYISHRARLYCCRFPSKDDREHR